FVSVARHRSQRRLDLGERTGVEQVAQLLLAEQLAQEVAVERERLGTPFGRRRVVLVHVGRDVVEQERGGHRRGRRGLQLDEVEVAGAKAVQDPAERGQVEDVLEAFAVRLQDDRKRSVGPRDLEQALRLEALLPERRALPGTPTRDQEGTPRVLAE